MMPTAPLPRPRLQSTEDPRPEPNEVLMRVRGSSLNYRDLMVLKGGGRGPTKPGVIPVATENRIRAGAAAGLIMGGDAYVLIDIQNYTSVQPEEPGNSVCAAVNLGFVASQEKLRPRGIGDPLAKLPAVMCRC